jgi:pimeloyl-ACP methyl ester carboxylesterase
MSFFSLARKTGFASVGPVLLLLLADSGTNGAGPAEYENQESSNTAIQYVDCWTDSLRESGARCGLLLVPVSYDEPLGPTRKVSFAVMPALEASPAAEKELVLFLIGGPGPAGTFTDEFADDGPGAYVRHDRKLIMVDYRGTGMSEPFLGCAGPEDVAACKQALDDSGMVSELRTAVFVKDADRLLGELGYDSASIYSGSYGTRVALTMMRDVPERISHVVLDGVFPPEVNGFAQGSRAILAGLNRIAEACEADFACTEQLGNIRGKIMALAAAWADREEAGELLEALATLSHFQAAPLLVHEMSTMSPDESARLVAQFREKEEDGPGDSDDDEDKRSQSFVMALGVVCSEEAAFIDRQPLDTTRHRFAGPMIEVLRDFSGGAPFPPSQAEKICNILEIGAAPEVEMEPVESEIPTLVLSGGMDLDTSFEWGELAASRLASAQHFVFPFAGHVVAMEDSCAKDITGQFLRNPDAALDTSCLQEQHRRSQALILHSSDVVAEIEKELPEKRP